MRTFEIIDSRSRNKAPCGVLRYDESSGEMGISIAPDAKESGVPMLFIPFMRKGQREIPAEWSLRWVQERIVPPSRQNLGEILRANGMREYNELDMLLVGEGRCSQDDFYVREVPSYVYASVPFGGEWPSAQAKANWRADAVSAGKEVAAARKRAGLTQRELAQKAGVRQGDISRIETGKANPTLETLSAIAAALGGRLKVAIER